MIKSANACGKATKISYLSREKEERSPINSEASPLVGAWSDSGEARKRSVTVRGKSAALL